MLYNLSESMRHDFSMDDKVFLHQSQIITRIAEEGSCIIVGRCADYVLQQRKNVIKVFIYADLDSRRHHIANVYGQAGENALDDIEKNDKKRAMYYGYYSGRSWGSARNYDICLNSSALGIDKCVQILKEMYTSLNAGKNS